MKTKLTFLLALTFLFLFSGSVFGDDLKNAVTVYFLGDFKRAYKLFLPLAEKGHTKAQTMLGIMYDEGQGVPQDYKEAIKWYQLAAEQGLGKAQFNLGNV